MNADISQLLSQLGVSGIFAMAIVVMAKVQYQHYEDEIKYLRNKVDSLESEFRKARIAMNVRDSDGKKSDAIPF